MAPIQAKANYELCVRHNCAVDAEDVPLLVYNRLGQIYLMQGDLVAVRSRVNCIRLDAFFACICTAQTLADVPRDTRTCTH